MTGERILIIDDSAESQAWLAESVLRPAGYAVEQAAGLNEARLRIAASPPHAIVLDAQLGSDNGLALLPEFASTLPIVVTTTHRALDEVLSAFRAGASDVLVKPFEPEQLSQSIARALRATQAVAEREALRALTERQAQEFNALYNLGKTITALLDVDAILAQVVSAAVNLTRADEGSLLLLDPDSGELYLRANKNLDEDAARNLRIKVDDNLMGRVIQTGRPVMMSGADLVKVKTSFLVKAILNVPMIVAGRAIGVLSVDYRRSNQTFREHDVHLLSTLADYAAIAIENARLYWAAEGERAKLQAILRDVQDGVIVTDPDLRLMLVNNAACAAFGLTEAVIGARLSEVIKNSALLDLFAQGQAHGHAWRAEIPLDDGRTLQGQLSELSEIGFGAVLRDISRLKELDRIKSEFISIVSHDLRTPLTTIRGYIDLLARVGPLNAMQQEFVARVEHGTGNIVELISDLLDVSRIEAGLDWEMEPIDLPRVVQEAATALQPMATAKRQLLTVQVFDLSAILGNSQRLGQVVTNLVNNAIKYTPEDGRIEVVLRDDGGFVVLEVHDTGIGIPAEDQLRIFDKFYRVESDATLSIGGTGLGLSIVKGIVEKHKGRVWVESEVGVGSKFYVLLPKYAA
ncbi:MAG TPA: ATP-binding protein [Anaerolineae bacterium]|nr:ATP-binding protein [Anaerolineae bacterium]